MARSVKGTVSINWNSEAERNALLTQLVGDAERFLGVLDSEAFAAKRPTGSVKRARELLGKVTYQDVEQMDDGSYRIRRGTAPDRVISITDPTARHGRKSSSKVIRGHKTHALATIDSGMVTGIVVTDAARHDASPCAELVRQAEASGLKPERVLGDAAYGTGQNRRDCAAMGVAVLTKLGQSGTKAFAKSEFDIDLAAGRVTCPAGQSTESFTMVLAGDKSGVRVRCYRFDKQVCAACPLAHKCCKDTAKGKARKVTLSRFEAEQQQAKAFNATPEAKPLLRKRCAIERTLSHLMRYGLRLSRYFGQKATQFQAYMTAAAYNLQRIATLLAERAAALAH